MKLWGRPTRQGKRLYFLAGLARTGSTLLASLLNQHPDIFASGTSPLMDLLCETDASINRLRQRYSFDSEAQHHAIYEGIIDSFYKHCPQPIIFDKHRGWPRNGRVLQRFVPEVKIVCTVRPVAEIIASFIKLIEQAPGRPNFVDEQLARRDLPFTTENRARVLWEEYSRDSYDSLLHGLEHLRPHMLLVSYSELVRDPEAVLKRIFQFTGIKSYRGFNFEQIENITVEKDDEGWGMPGLHTIRPRLGATSTPPSEVLGESLARFFQTFDGPLRPHLV